jgi:hypothetical protein
MKPFALTFLTFAILLTGCSRNSSAAVETSAPTSTATPGISSPSPTIKPSDTPASPSQQVVVDIVTSVPTQLPSPIPSLVPSPTFDPAAWSALPVIPQMDERVREIFLRGQELGNNPHAFSKIGDCGSTPAWFLGDFDRGEKYYSLGDYQDLAGVIQAFQGSFARTSLAAKSGFNASSVFAPLWADRSQCLPDESPLACEYRVQKPAYAFIMLGSNDVWHEDTFEPQMRKIIEFSIDNGVIPILSTKADNIEGDNSINTTIARLAVEYGVPLWNYWLAVQPLEDTGLQEDNVHITWGPNRFDDPLVMKKGWPVRNLTALQVLDVVWRYASGS